MTARGRNARVAVIRAVRSALLEREFICEGGEFDLATRTVRDGDEWVINVRHPKGKRLVATISFTTGSPQVVYSVPEYHKAIALICEKVSVQLGEQVSGRYVDAGGNRKPRPTTPSHELECLQKENKRLKEVLRAIGAMAKEINGD